MATKKPAKRGKKLSARKRRVKDLDASKAGGVKGGVISRSPSTVKLD
jgi:hypothetical protein